MGGNQSAPNGGFWPGICAWVRKYTVLQVIYEEILKNSKHLNKLNPMQLLLQVIWFATDIGMGVETGVKIS